MNTVLLTLTMIMVLCTVVILAFLIPQYIAYVYIIIVWVYGTLKIIGDTTID